MVDVHLSLSLMDFAPENNKLCLNRGKIYVGLRKGLSINHISAIASVCIEALFRFAPVSGHKLARHEASFNFYLSFVAPGISFPFLFPREQRKKSSNQEKQ